MKKLKIKVNDTDSVSGILQLPDDAWCMMVLAHGAGAGMEHSFMQQVANRLENRGVATLRFNFLYMEKGGGRPDLPHVAYSVLKATVAKAQEAIAKKKVPIVGAGKSFGGRMFGQLMSTESPPDVAALVFYGFPLHAPGKDGKERAEHLSKVKIPMLFLQGTRDSLANIELIKEVVKSLKKGTISIIEGGDHSFKVPKSAGKTEAQVFDHLVEETVKWLKKSVKG